MIIVLGSISATIIASLYLTYAFIRADAFIRKTREWSAEIVRNRRHDADVH